MKLSIIVPVYNEQQTINEVIERVMAVDLGAIEREVIIANDGSCDGTRRVIEERTPTSSSTPRNTAICSHRFSIDAPTSSTARDSWARPAASR